MKKLKLIIIALFILFITGCDGSYEIEIYKNKVTETTYAWYQNVYTFYSYTKSAIEK